MDTQEYVVFEPGKPVKLVFDAYGWVDKDIFDKVLEIVKKVESLTFHVVEMDGEKVDMIYSVIAKGIKNELLPYLEGGKYKEYEFTILKGFEIGIGAKLIETHKKKS